MSKPLQNRRILVVDDEPYIPVLLRRFLSGKGAQVYTALNAREALRLFPNVRPDLVILDDSLPDMNGWQVCLHIQTESRVPIIYLSAAGLPAGTSEYDTCNTDCIPKPFHLNVLLAHVEAALRRADRKHTGA